MHRLLLLNASRGMTAALVVLPLMVVSGCGMIQQSSQPDSDNQNQTTTVDDRPHPTLRKQTGELSQQRLDQLVATISQETGAQVGLAVHTKNEQLLAGQNMVLPAWSTIKVPLSLAALEGNDKHGQRDDGTQRQQHNNIAAAIRNSDNDAAETLWLSLGTPEQAGQQVQNVMRQGGDAHTMVQTQRVRSEYSAFGQTLWALPDQAEFFRNLACLPAATEIMQAMGEISAEQSYGLGRLPEFRFKGGWGPALNGAYTVRQAGVNVTGSVSVAVQVVAADGTYNSGQLVLNRIADSLQGLLHTTGGTPACAE